MRLFRSLFVVALGAGLAVTARGAQAQDAKQIVQQAVNAELAAERNDHTHWRYLKHVNRGEAVAVVETDHGTIGRHLAVDGKPVPEPTLHQDDATIQHFIHDPGMQAKQRRDEAHDDKNATEMLNLLPVAFDWTIGSQNAETILLTFHPNPKFNPPDMESRVMGQMEGTMVVDKTHHRIRSMKGRLVQDINIGFGVLGKLRKGGTFNVERREIAPGLWQITEMHVHIGGRALLFKTIGQQQDEVKSEFAQVPVGTTLEQAAAMLQRERADRGQSAVASSRH